MLSFRNIKAYDNVTGNAITSSVETMSFLRKMHAADTLVIILMFSAFYVKNVWAVHFFKMNYVPRFIHEVNFHKFWLSLPG